jgi:hypothetical protein
MFKHYEELSIIYVFVSTNPAVTKLGELVASESVTTSEVEQNGGI